MSKRLTVDQRREIFHAIVTTQDTVPDVPKSRQMVMKQFHITEATLKQIEDEGIDRQWPPLDDEEVEVEKAIRA
jgi:ribonuclease HII